MFDIQPLELGQVEDRSQARQTSQTLKAEGREVKHATQDLEQGPRQDWELEPGTSREIQQGLEPDWQQDSEEGTRWSYQTDFNILDRSSKSNQKDNQHKEKHE